MSILAIIPARGGSVGLKNKNMYPLNGKPLLYYTLDAAKKTKLIDRVIVSSDSKKILNFSKKNLVEVIKRPKKISGSKSTTHEAVIHCLNFLKKNENYIPDIIIVLQPTSPLRNSKHINKAIEIFLKDKKAISLVSCVKVPHTFHPMSLMKESNEGYLVNFLKKKKFIFRRQDKDLLFARNGAAIYIIKYQHVKKFLFGGKIIKFIMDEDASIDIDSLSDIKKAKKILKIKKK
jgi:CMP-N,N'-diacetyllegionaminic acid synthase